MFNLKSLLKDPGYFISVEKLKTEMDLHNFGVILDLRSIEEFGQGHLETSMSLPFNELPLKIASLVPVKTTRVFCYDATGEQAYEAAKKLREMGYQLSFALDGGIDGWKVKGFKVLQ